MKISFSSLYLALLSFFITFTTTSHAHQFQASQVKIALHSSSSYELNAQVDFIALAQATTKLPKDHDQALAEVKKLSRLQLYQFINKATQELEKQLVIYFDNQASYLTEITPPDIDQLTYLLSGNNDNLPITFTGYGETPANAKAIAFQFPEYFGKVNITLTRPVSALVTSGDKTVSFELPQNSASGFNLQISTALTYVYQGIIHIIPKGLDHILFVLALFLFATKLSTLLWQVTAFTLAHTITLALGMLGYLNLPATIVEPLIALSIAYVAIENIRQTPLNRWRLLIIFAFGLLHGLGFASVLSEVGLPQDQWITSLLAFNVGVELGQLSVIFIAFALLGWWIKRPWYHTRVVMPLSILIGAAGFYWFIERIYQAI